MSVQDLFWLSVGVFFLIVLVSILTDSWCGINIIDNFLYDLFYKRNTLEALYNRKDYIKLQRKLQKDDSPVLKLNEVENARDYLNKVMLYAPCKLTSLSDPEIVEALIFLKDLGYKVHIVTYRNNPYEICGYSHDKKGLLKIIGTQKTK